MVVLLVFLHCINGGIWKPHLSSPPLNSSISSSLFCLSGSAKLAIWLTPKHRTNGAGSAEPVRALEGRLKTRLRMEHSCRQMTGSMPAFIRTRAVRSVLFSVGVRMTS